ncbi:MAG: hypothetical protein P8Y97_22890 [Candidatus Lokiarchaeota archaeon]
MYNWIHIINSLEDYKDLWNKIFNIRELHLGMFIVVNGSLTLKNGTELGNKGEIFAAIITYTYEKETMDRLIELGKINPSTLILFDDITQEELTDESEYSSGIKKEIKNFEKPSEFRNYLEKVRYKDFYYEK